jgi:Ni,Fe-hydrogenase III small subunit
VIAAWGAGAALSSSFWPRRAFRPATDECYVPGCSPPPRAILAGLVVAMGIREARHRLEHS